MKPLSLWRKTISGKLTIIYAAFFITVLLLLNGAALLGIRYFIFNNARQDLIRTTDFVLQRINSSLDLYETELMEEISQADENIYFRILSTNQRIVAQSNLLKGMDLPIENDYQEINLEGKNYIYISKLILKQGYFIGYLQAVRDISLEYRFLKMLAGVLVLTSFVGSIGAIIIVYTVTRKTLQPINMITNIVKSISASDLAQRLKISGPEDELSNLARTFNSMLDRLEEAFQHQQQFVADASHELRTPISVIQGYINLLDRWGKNEVEVRDEAIAAIKKEVENMNSLVEGLLFLARGDSERIEINKKEFSVFEMLEEIIKETEMLAGEVKVIGENESQAVIYGDPKLIKQMLRIFIDNSLKYTPAGGEVKIAAQDRGEEIELVVEDTGIGIPEKDLPHIFDRFYRVDKARSSREGTGLGLSIAKWILDKHQGRVQVESTIGEGTRVRVFLPQKGAVMKGGKNSFKRK